MLYDIDDESDRNSEQRPFPFLSTMDPADYLTRHLTAWTAPTVVFRVVGKYPEPDLRAWLDAQDPDRVLSVFVGASTREKEVAMSLKHAHELRAEARPQLALGGVAIPERHTRSRDEHLRLLAKQDTGCTFFVTQVVYDVNAAKNIVSDYHVECAARDVDPAPIVFTFTVVGSMKTLEFLTWLGVDVPRWIQNEMKHSDDVLATASYRADPLRRPRPHRVLPAARHPVRARHRKRLQPRRRDRASRAARRAAEAGTNARRADRSAGVAVAAPLSRWWRQPTVFQPSLYSRWYAGGRGTARAVESLLERAVRAGHAGAGVPVVPWPELAGSVVVRPHRRARGL